MSLSHTSAPAAIDSTLLVLLADSDDDLTDPPTIAKVQGYKPNKKIAGSRQKAKGKQRAQDEQSHKRKHVLDKEDIEDVEEEASKHGHPRGAGSYALGDVKVLLDLVKCKLPLGQRGWQIIHHGYVHWARSHNRPVHTMKSLETKYKQVSHRCSHQLLYLTHTFTACQTPKANWWWLLPHRSPLCT